MVKKYLKIDGISYPVHLVDVQRKADALDAYAYRTEDGMLHRKPIGIFINYTVSVGTENDIELYDKLFEVLSTPKESFQVQFPNEDSPQGRYISSVQDSISRVTEQGTLYKALTFNCICVAPTRKA